MKGCWRGAGAGARRSAGGSSNAAASSPRRWPGAAGPPPQATDTGRIQLRFPQKRSSTVKEFTTVFTCQAKKWGKNGGEH